MDGTFADVSPIAHYVTGPHRNFHAFHTESVTVSPNTPVVDLARHAHDLGHRIVVVTARDARYRPETAWWLAEHGIPSDALYMRAHGDGRKDVAVKADLLTRLSRRFAPVHAVDDNPSVIRLWQSHDIDTTVVDSQIAADPRYQ